MLKLSELSHQGKSDKWHRRQRVAQPNSMLLEAILESDQGNVFVKLTGPEKLVKASQDDFRKLIR